LERQGANEPNASGADVAARHRERVGDGLASQRMDILLFDGARFGAAAIAAATPRRR
jgi:hypothetical protein